MLDIKKLIVGYGKKIVLDDISISFTSSEIHGIVGRNGVGKTTLFNTIYGILEITEGEISLDSNTIYKKDISFLENDNYFYPFMKGREYLQLIKNNSKIINYLNEIFELPLEDYIEEYSTGMQKKLSFMGCIIQDKKIILLDEPFNNLDLESIEKIKLVLKKIKSDKYIIISSHILDTLYLICDKITIIENKELVATFQSEEFNKIKTFFEQNVHSEIDSAIDKYLKERR